MCLGRRSTDRCKHRREKLGKRWKTAGRAAGNWSPTRGTIWSETEIGQSTPRGERWETSPCLKQGVRKGALRNQFGREDDTPSSSGSVRRALGEVKGMF